MKKTIYKIGMLLGTLVILYFLYAIIKTSSGTSWITSLTAPRVPSKTYQLETEGYNMRLYTFTHPSDDKKECIAIASSDGSGVTCW